jgi:hypothetical protein
MLGGDMTTKITLLESDLKIYFWVVFGYSSGLIPLRSFPEKGNPDSRPITNAWVPADDHVHGKVLSFANAANRRKAAFYVIPGTVNKTLQASSADVMEMQVLLIDIDEGDTESKLLEMTAVIGEPTMVVDSGGITKEGYPKLHVYWQLLEAVSGEDLRVLLDLRHKIALAFGGDTHFKSAHQPIRVAGSVYHKGGNARLVKIRSYSRMEYDLQELVERLSYLPPIPNDKTSSDDLKIAIHTDAVIPPLNEIMTSKIHEGGNAECSRFANLQRITGYWLRRYHEGLVTQGEALEEIIAYNEANVVPPWPIERLKPMVSALWKKHMQEHGEARKAEDEKQPPRLTVKLQDWTATRYVGTAPKQLYLVESVIPMRVATILAATGDAGKSMLLLNLALQVAGDDTIAESFGHMVNQRGTAIVFTAEDDVEEVHRRLEYLDPAGRRHKYPERLIIVPLASTGGPLSCIVKSREGIRVSAEFMALKEQVTTIANLKLIVFDPLSSFVQADISKDPSDGSFVTSVFASLATETGAAVILAHYMRKAQGNYQINTPEEAREAVRGSGALVDGVRNVYSFWQSSQEEQKMVFSMMGMEYQRNKVYRGAVVKSNSAADREVHVFFRSDKGLLQDISALISDHQLAKDQQFLVLRNSIAHSAAEGFPYTHTGQSGIYRQRHKLPKFFHNLTRQKLEDLAQEMLNTKPAIIVKGRAKGSKEEKWLDVPGGKFALGEGEFTYGAEAEIV